MRNYFTFNGFDSHEFGVYISGGGTFDSPTRDYNVISVQGRSGDLIGEGTRLENVEVTYSAFIYTNFAENLANLRSALLSTDGYARLEDTYHPNEYRMAYFDGPIVADVTPHNNMGSFDLKFKCKPQRWLTSGETAQVIASGGTIVNPTRFASSPLIRVTGYGELIVGNDVIDIINAFPYVDIDSEIMDCYHGTDNANAQVTFSNVDFPKLASGSTGISYSGHITQVAITPRWFEV